MAKSKQAKAGEVAEPKYIVLAQDDGTKDIYAYPFQSLREAGAFAYVIGGKAYRINPV